SATLDEFNATIARTGADPSRIQVIKGWFDQTVPRFTPEPIAVLRLDGDWYDSTMICLKRFWDFMLPGGVILIDDYYAWDGCSRAFTDSLPAHKQFERTQQPNHNQPFVLATPKPLRRSHQ